MRRRIVITEWALNKFWSIATSRGTQVAQGFKMKWHNIGRGRVQLRVCVALIDDVAYLCRAYVKTGKALEEREMARFDLHIERIHEGRYEFRGEL